MYASSFCKLMRINVFIFSQHGIRAIKEFENTRVRVSSCGQFRQPIQRPCHTPVVLQSSRSLTEAKPLSEHLATGEIFWRPPFQPKSTPTGVPPSDLPSDGSLAGKYLTTSPHALISGPTLKFMSRRVAARETLFGHTPPLVGAFATNKPIHLLHVPRRRRKNTSFSLFLSGHCFYVFYYVAIISIVFVFSKALRHLQDLGSCFC